MIINSFPIFTKKLQIPFFFKLALKIKKNTTFLIGLQFFLILNAHTAYKKSHGQQIKNKIVHIHKIAKYNKPRFGCFGDILTRNLTSTVWFLGKS